MAKSNWVKAFSFQFIIGSGKNLSDFTYVDNVAHAHICAEESLSSQMGSVSGKVFFITNLEPMEFWEFASLLLEGLGYQRPVTSLPAWATHFIVLIIKLLHMKSDTRKLDPFVSVYNVATLALRTRTFSCSAAQKHIRYIPIVSMEEAVESTVDSYSHLAVDSPFMICKDSNEPSKVEKLLGSGKVADLLLWRDEKKTFLCFFFLAFLYHWFFLSGRTFISSVAKLLLLIIVLLCGHYILPLTGYESSIPRLPSSCFEISEVDMRNSFFTMRCMWNKLDSLAKSLAQGEDWGTFLKASIFLYFFKLIVPPHFTVAVGLGLILSFSLCFVYEQYEERIDVIASVVLTVAERVLMLFVRKLPMSSSSVSFNCQSIRWLAVGFIRIVEILGSEAVPDAGKKNLEVLCTYGLFGYQVENMFCPINHRTSLGFVVDHNGIFSDLAAMRSPLRCSRFHSLVLLRFWLILLTMDNKGYCNEGGNVQWYSSVEFFLIPPSIFL
ncbi:UNVERIFIED_CONTAM: 3beta-hydroxysteroid-dehydrogenase/decarboxylase isoform 3 [Sesamum calycinum]|uniref:Reticulon-like protein n=1 Tax=Sesamum calycinum TaxID=2727403 RepID=A0AAW2RAD5_9LAMI